jgi:hypothetical protein
MCKLWYSHIYKYHAAVIKNVRVTSEPSEATRQNWVTVHISIKNIKNAYSHNTHTFSFQVAEALMVISAFFSRVSISTLAIYCLWHSW